MTTESLIVELDAKTSKLEAALKSATDRLDELEDSTTNADSGFNKLTKTAGLVGGAMKKTATGVIAVGTALTTMIVLTAKGEQELQAMSRQAKLTTGDFEALAFATKQYGINAEQIADISKDVSDKLGEFSTVGTGAFQDFADVTGKSTEEAQKLAAEWSNLSSQQILINVANDLEAVGASADQTTFVLESLGNDVSKLAPLLANNGAELKELTSRYNEFNSQLSITEEEAKSLTAVATSFDLMTESAGNATKKIAASFAPALDTLINSVIEVIPQATQVVLDFFNSFQSAENIGSIREVDAQIQKTTDDLTKWGEQINFLETQGSTFGVFDDEQIASYNKRVEEGIERLSELQARREELANKGDAPQANTPEGGRIGASGDSDDIQTILDRFKTEEQLLEEKYLKEQELLAGNKEALLLLEMEYQNNLQEIRKESIEKQAQEYENVLREQAKIDKQNVESVEKNEKAKNSAIDKSLQLSAAANHAFFEDNKGVKAGLIVADTAAAAMSEYAKGGPWAAAAAIAFGAVQLANLQSATSSGGSVSASSAPPTPPQQTEQPGTIDISNSDISGANEVIIRFEGDTDSELTAMLFNKTKAMQVSGEI